MQRAFLIAGAGGMLGTALQRVLAERGIAYQAPAEGCFDICDEAGVRRAVDGFAESLEPGVEGVLFNAAAYTNVERAEDEPERAYAVNEAGAANLARAAARASVRFVHISTDFVFDGTKDDAYTEADAPNPLSAYGASKLAGERAVARECPNSLIVRTAWVFAPAGANFPLKVLAAARERGRLSVVTDEIGSPTYTPDLAAGALALVEAGASGLYHLTGSGACSRYELAVEVLRLAGLGAVPIEPVLSDAFPTKAARPANSVLECSKAAALGVRLPDWHDAVARFVGGLREARAPEV